MTDTNEIRATRGAPCIDSIRERSRRGPWTEAQLRADVVGLLWALNEATLRAEKAEAERDALRTEYAQCAAEYRQECERRDSLEKERDAAIIFAQTRGPMCQCSDEESCRLVRERDAAIAERDARPSVSVDDLREMLAHLSQNRNPWFDDIADGVDEVAAERAWKVLCAHAKASGGES